jgi:toxin-antitoxin system PIN domain toxin
VIIPDINLLAYAYNTDAPDHEEAREWWSDCLSERQMVGIPWVVILGFVRIMTSRVVMTDPMIMTSRVVMTDPMDPLEALDRTRSWLYRPQAHLLVPGPRHLEILTEIMGAARASGRLTTDAHLAAMAIETQAELHSNDADFSRFPGLRWTNPLSG